MICELAISTTLSCGALNTTRGESDAARFVAEQARKTWQQVKSSHTFGAGVEGALDELSEIAETCAQPNWDGHSAAPISIETYRQAYRFLECLPLGFHAPSVGIEPDGQVTFEWYRNPRRTVTVSISELGELHYAALIGRNQAYGTEAFIGQIPRAIIELVHRILSYERIA